LEQKGELIMNLIENICRIMAPIFALISLFYCCKIAKNPSWKCFSDEKIKEIRDKIKEIEKQEQKAAERVTYNQKLEKALKELLLEFDLDIATVNNSKLEKAIGQIDSLIIYNAMNESTVDVIRDISDFIRVKKLARDTNTPLFRLHFQEPIILCKAPNSESEMEGMINMLKKIKETINRKDYENRQEQIFRGRK
jgi:hypothetical protein